MLISLGIALVTLMMKCPAFSNPLGGYFGSYQAVNAMMAEMMGGGSVADLFIPRTFILVNGAPGLHLLYYPFGSLVAFLSNTLLGGGIPWWGRFQAGIFVFGATILLFPIARRFLTEKKALLTVFFFSFFPMVLLSGITFQNEAAALFFLMLSFWLLDSAVLAKILLSGLVFSLALTARIHFGIALPAFLIWINREKFSFRTTFVFLIGAAIPVAAWVFWMHVLQFHDAAHVQTSLFTQSGEGRFLITSLFKSFDFYKRILSILGTYWCTPILFPFALISLFRLKKEPVALLVWAWGSLSLILILPQKVMDHPFYLLCGAPAVAILITSLLGLLWDRWGLTVKLLFCGAFILLTMRYYLPPASRFSEVERNMPRIGSVVQQISRPEDVVIVQYGPSAGLLYYCHRKGWSFDLGMSKAGGRHLIKQARHQQLFQEGYGDPIFWLEKLRRDGAKFLVISGPSEYYASTKFSDYVRSHFKPVAIPDRSFLIFRLEEK